MEQNKFIQSELTAFIQSKETLSFFQSETTFLFLNGNLELPGITMGFTLMI